LHKKPPAFGEAEGFEKTDPKGKPLLNLILKEKLFP